MNLSNFRSTEINKKQKLDKIITTSMIQHELFWQSHWRFLFGFAYDLHLTVELRAWFYRPFDSYENKQLMSLVLTHSIVRYIIDISPLLYDINTCFVGFRADNRTMYLWRTQSNILYTEARNKLKKVNIRIWTINEYIHWHILCNPTYAPKNQWN